MVLNTFLRYVNRTGFPCIESNSVTTDGTVTTINFESGRLLVNNFQGGFWVRIPQEIETGTNTIQFSSPTLPVYLSSGEQATAADFATTGGGVFLVFFDRTANRLQLIA